MNPNKYQSNIQELLKLQDLYLANLDIKVLNVLEQLKEEAIKLDDNSLLGYTYHSLAYAYYFIDDNYDAYLKNLALATNTLLNSKDQSELFNVYYLMANDALNKGIYNLSYYYFTLAKNVASDNNQNIKVALMEEKLGHILNVLKLNKEAISYYRKSLKAIKKEKQDPQYIHNISSCYMNESNVYMDMGNYDKALISLIKANQFLNKYPDKFSNDDLVKYAILGAKMAAYQNDEELLDSRLDEIVNLLNNHKIITNYITNIKDLSVYLIIKKKYKLVKRLIDAIKDKVLDSDITFAKQEFIKIRINYHKAINDTESLLQDYLIQDEINEIYIHEQNRMNRLVQDFINLTIQLRYENVSLQDKRNELVRNSLLDPLTKVHNRYAGDLHINKEFETSYQQKEKIALCVVDLDNLQTINNTYGHEAGDKALKSLGNALIEISKDPKVFVSRYGGDEFVITISNMETNEIELLLNRLHELTDVKFSIGVINIVPKGKMKPWDLFNSADNQLYNAKQMKHLKPNNVCITTKLVENK